VRKTRNKFEKKLERFLKRNSHHFEYESERLAYILARYYVPDFILWTPTGKVYIEAKGYLRPEHKSKMVAVKKQHPEKDIRIVFYAWNAKNIKWAEKYGFKYAIGNIPKEWLNGL